MSQIVYVMLSVILPLRHVIVFPFPLRIWAANARKDEDAEKIREQLMRLLICAKGHWCDTWVTTCTRNYRYCVLQREGTPQSSKGQGLVGWTCLGSINMLGCAVLRSCSRIQRFLSLWSAGQKPLDPRALCCAVLRCAALCCAEVSDRPMSCAILFVNCPA